MVKEFALDNFGAAFFTKAKKTKLVKSTSTGQSFKLWFAIFLVAANTILLASYIYGVNNYASKGYQIQSLQNTLASLNSDNKQLNLQIAEASSMVSIQSDFLSANFVLAGTPQFLQDNIFTLNQSK